LVGSSHLQSIEARLTICRLEASRAQRIVWLLEECNGVEWQLETFNRRDDKLAPDELKKIHPLGKAPIIKIEAPTMAEPMVLAESGFMMEYLAEHFAPHLIPKHYQDGKDGQVGGETKEWLRYRYFMHYSEGSFMGILVLGLFVVSKSILATASRKSNH
jgi:glutathione S-transferase